MLDFLPEVIAAIQEATPTPLCFDNPSVDYQRVALEHYDRGKSPAPILNSIAASRERLDEMIELVRDHDTMVIVMASETFAPGGTAQCMNPHDSLRAAKQFVEILTTKANRRLDQILIDPGLAPVGADTYGLVNIGLDAMRLISATPICRASTWSSASPTLPGARPKAFAKNSRRLTSPSARKPASTSPSPIPTGSPAPSPPIIPWSPGFAMPLTRAAPAMASPSTSPASARSKPSWASAPKPNPSTSEMNATLPAATGDRPIWLRVGTLLDGFSTTPQRNAHIVYDKYQILFAGEQSPPRDLLDSEQQAPDAELPNHTLLPGLIDAHTHLFLEGGELDPAKRTASLHQSPNQLRELARARLEKLIHLGIVACRDAGDKDGVGLALSHLSSSPSHPLMPYIDSPGAAIHHRGRYGSFMAEPLEEYGSPAECVEARIRGRRRPHQADRHRHH